MLHAIVKAEMKPSNYEVVSAIIPGSDRAGEEIVFSCHSVIKSPRQRQTHRRRGDPGSCSHSDRADSTRRAFNRPAAHQVYLATGDQWHSALFAGTRK